MILSWVVALTRPPEWLYPVIRFVNAITEPVLRPFRRMIPPIRLGGAGAIDVSILLVFIIVAILRRAAAY